jgi:ribosomal protein L7/L12
MNELRDLESMHDDQIISTDEYNATRALINRLIYSAKLREKKRFDVVLWNLCPKTFKKIGTSTQTIFATSIDDAKKQVDRHPSTIKQIIAL